MPLWLELILALGGSALISTVVGFLFNYAINSEKNRKARAKEIADEVSKNEETMRKGIQALLRNSLYELYDKGVHVNGYATIDEKNNFENLYKQYHNLGKNGVMDSLNDEFMKLPTSKPAKPAKRKLTEKK